VDLWNAVAARQAGDDYQARWFWLQACRLLQPRTKVARVAYEKADAHSFDDVIVYYGDGMTDEDSRPLQADHFQVKFHVTSDKAVTWRSLMDPGFINAQRFSFLERLRDAQQKLAPNDGYGYRFFLYTRSPVDPADPLASVHSGSDGRVLWGKLSEGGPRSEMGKIRATLCKHLGLGSDQELQVVLRPLRIRTGPTMQDFRDQLNDRLELAGLRPVPDEVCIHPYDDLTRKLLQRGPIELTREGIEMICRAEGLWCGRTAPEPNTYRIGVRSFWRWAEQLEDQVDETLCLLRHFNGRYTASPELWHSQVLPALEQFLRGSVKRDRPNLLCLHAHSSIAFATGYCLDSRSGLDVALVQRRPTGEEIWRLGAPTGNENQPTWSFGDLALGDGHDVAVAVSLSQTVLEDVRAYAAANLPGVGRIIHCTVGPTPGQWSVSSGVHAGQLAEQLVAHLRACRSALERQGKLHLFTAAPNGFMFFLGQLARSLGTCLLYEYDLERNVLGAYHPSFLFPPDSRQ